MDKRVPPAGLGTSGRADYLIACWGIEDIREALVIPLIGSRIANMKRFEGLLLKPIKAAGAPHFTHPGTSPPDGRSRSSAVTDFLV